MKTLSGLILAMVLNQATLADSTLVSNPYLPYPPGCGRMPDLEAPGGLESQAIKFYGSQLQASAYRIDGRQTTTLTVPIRLRAYRAPCSEANRSLIWLEFVLSSKYADKDVAIPVPAVTAMTSVPWAKHPTLTVEPNTWTSSGLGVDRETRQLLSRTQGLEWYYGSPAGARRWVFLLDNPSPISEWWEIQAPVTAAEYNSAFELTVHLGYQHGELQTIIHVPATLDVLPGPAPGMPLSGRLSGNWVIPGTSDQGVMLTISEKIQPDVPNLANVDDRPMVAFLAHYTFDAAGNMLWLTGAAEFQPGATQVTIPIEKVTNGEFRGSRRGDREVIGNVRLTSRSCNHLGFEYDYSDLELGADSLHLERLFSLETAGHECRDYEARLAAIR